MKGEKTGERRDGEFWNLEKGSRGKSEGSLLGES